MTTQTYTTKRQDSMEVYTSPEFQALLKKLGLELSGQIESIHVRLEKDQQVKVDVTYHCTHVREEIEFERMK